MTILTPRKPVTQQEPQLLVESQFTPGRYRFQLVVTDDGGLQSDPAEIVVTVHEIVRPVPPRPTRPPIRPEVIERVDRIRPELIRPIRRPP